MRPGRAVKKSKRFPNVPGSASTRTPIRLAHVTFCRGAEAHVRGPPVYTFVANRNNNGNDDGSNNNNNDAALFFFVNKKQSETERDSAFCVICADDQKFS